MSGLNGLRQVEYKDERGYLSLRLIPREAPDSEAARGVVIGPPPLDALNLPEEIALKLNNELYHRGILTEQDLRKRRQDASVAVMTACRLDVDRILTVLAEQKE